MTPEDLLAAIAEASGDADSLRAVVRRCGESLTETGSDRIGLADALLSLLPHEDARVRQEIAEICELFPDPFFGLAYETLSKDANGFVCRAAERASARKAVQQKKLAKTEEKGRELAGVIEELERRFGKEARRLGARAATLGAGDEILRTRHELGRAAEALDGSLREIERELGKPAPGPGTLREHTRVARERFEHLVSVMTSRPVFARATLRDLVDKAKDHVRVAACADVAIDVEVDRGLALDADAPSLRQALENALKNAVEAQRGRPGAVRVRARSLRKGAVVEIEIEDSGVGMGDEELARLFVPFDSRKPGGTGVGMVTVKRIVEDLHRGELLVTSVKDEGTRVVMRLPGKQVRA